MKPYIREICFGLLWVSLMTGCASYPHKTLSLDTHLVQVTRRVQRAVVKITTPMMLKTNIWVWGRYPRL